MRKYVISVCAILCLGILLFTQDAKHDVTVALKLIQVYVTDSSGNPVTDLDKSEFLIYDNKRLCSITDFERHMLFPPKKEIQPIPERVEPNPARSSSEVMNRKFFFFFDLCNNNAKGFQKSQEAALHFIDNQLQPSDEVGIISYSVLKQLTLHEYLSKDRQAIRNVVQRLGGMGRVGRAENFEAMVWQQMSGESLVDASQFGQPVKEGAPAHLKDPTSPTLSKTGYEGYAVSPGSFESNNRFKRNEYKTQIRNLFARIIDLSKALRYISGHKHIIFFSSGIPYSLIHGVETQSPFQPDAYGVDTVLRNKFEEVLKELSAANATVFSVNTESLATNMNLPAHQKGESILRRISQYTGGKFIGNVQNYAQVLDTVQTFTGSYYVLGYYVDESWDGKYHSINVKVTRPKCKVFAQKGYFNPKDFSKYSTMEKELHLIDLALTEKSLLQTPVHLPMKALPCPIDGNPGVMLMAQIPEEKIGESIGQKAEIFFMVFDEKENILDLKRKAMKVSALKGKRGYYYSLMPISPGKYKFRIVIRDMDSGNGAVGRHSMEIPKALAQGPQILPPLLLAPGKSGLFVRGYIPEKINNEFPLLDFFPFDPASYSPLLGEIPKNTQKLLAVIHCSMKNLSNPLLKFSASLVDSTSGQSFSIPAGILSGKKQGDMGTLLVEFKMPEIKPGDYILIISVEDTISLEQSQTRLTCRVI